MLSTSGQGLPEEEEPPHDRALSQGVSRVVRAIQPYWWGEMLRLSLGKLILRRFVLVRPYFSTRVTFYLGKRRASPEAGAPISS